MGVPDRFEKTGKPMPVTLAAPACPQPHSIEGGQAGFSWLGQASARGAGIMLEMISAGHQRSSLR